MIEKKKKWKLADFDYPLPEKYIDLSLFPKVRKFIRFSVPWPEKQDISFNLELAT